MIKKILIISVLFLVLYLSVQYTIGKDSFKSIKSILPPEKQKIIKKYLYPNIYIKQYEPYRYDTKIKNSLDDLIYKKNNEKTLKYKNLKLKLYQNHETFLFGINNTIPGSAYLDIYDNYLFVISSIGILGYGEINDNEIVFKQIKNNIDEFINVNQFKKKKWFSIKDIKIFNNNIYVSYTKELKDNCWNTSIISANLNYKESKFKELFSPNECVDSKKNLDNEFHGQESGGRIIDLDQNHILTSVGEYRSRFLAQDKNSVFGKIIKININTGKSELVSMGHRNPQGLFFDKQNNFILETEHGPQGGDEINLIELNKENIPNYGWAVASYGEHYGGKSEANKEKYKKYPLLKSHKDNGFIEPLKYFVTSIGISEIVGLGTDKSYVVSSLSTWSSTDQKGKSLYFFNLNTNNEIQNIERVKVGERIRDLIFFKNKLIMFLEDSASIGLINLQ